MTTIPDNQFRGPDQLNTLVGVSSSRLATLADQRLEVTSTCQDSNNPSLVILEFQLAGLFYYMPIIKILQVDDETNYETNGVVAPIYRNDTRFTSIPIAALNGNVNGKILVDFGSVIPNFLSAQKIRFKLEMVPQSSTVPGTVIATQPVSSEFTWEKGLLPTPYTIAYEQGVLKVYFQYLGLADCSCNIQCVTPSGVNTDLNFCPNDVQAVNITKDLDGDPFTFNIIVRDTIGNTSTLDVTTLINVIPSSPILNLYEPSNQVIRNEISINRLSIRGISVFDADYQIIKYVDSPSSYVIWKDWSARGWNTFTDYDIKPGHIYGYSVRYKGKYGDISEFSPWATINTTRQAYSVEIDNGLQFISFSEGEFITGFNHNSYETDANAAYPDIQFINGTILDENVIGKLKFPERFKLVHSSVIPRGPNRGKIIGWDLQPVIGLAPTVDASNLWSFQSWSIIDCSQNPTGYKFQNYLLPLGPYVLTPSPPTIDNELVMTPNLFCAGHTWTKNGDLVVAGGMLWTPSAGQYADDKTFGWSPVLPNTASVAPENAPYFFTGFTGGHYGIAGTGGAGYGAWTQGPNLNIKRYYPTLTASHYLTGRLGGDQVIYVFGGSANGYANKLGSNYAITNVVTSIEPGFVNSYEALRITGKVTTGECGFTGDFYNGTGCFVGPQQYISLQDFDNVQSDGFYTYPRMHVLTDGSVFMSSPAPRSSKLVDPDNLPGIWSYDNGYKLNSESYTGFRRYGSDALYPNINGKENIIIRTAGDLGLIPTLGVNFPYSTWESNSAQFIDAGSSSGSYWAEGPSLKTTKGTSNLVILPDASLMSVGGAYIPTDRYPVPGRQTLAGPAPLETNPWFDHDHHTEEGYGGNHDLVANSNGGIGDGSEIGFFIYHRYPEILYPGASSWKLLTNSKARAKTNRHYHSTAVLLPDGRVLIGGGENRQAGTGVDYEIFEPHYLRPPVGWTTPLPRPKNVVITNATINTAFDHGAYDLSYNNNYTITCDSFEPYSIAKIVLMSPCSVTHHSDFNQRYRELVIVSKTDNRVTFTSPLNDKYWMPGFHMLFVLSNVSVPSEAIWVKF